VKNEHTKNSAKMDREIAYGGGTLGYYAAAKLEKIALTPCGERPKPIR
jgi:hypothetical protein